MMMSKINRMSMLVKATGQLGRMHSDLGSGPHLDFFKSNSFKIFKSIDT